MKVKEERGDQKCEHERVCSKPRGAAQIALHTVRALPSLVETSKKGKEGKSWRRKKCRHNWVCVRSDVVVAGKLATLIGG